MNYQKLITYAAALLFTVGCGTKDAASLKLRGQSNRTNVLSGLHSIIDEPQNTTFVVGALAPVSDVLGIIDIETRLQSELAQRQQGGFFPLGITKFDVDALQNPYEKNTVTVGTPENNSLVDFLKVNLDRPYERALPPTGTGVIVGYRLPTGKVALVVTGRTSEDVRKAASALAKYDDVINGKKVDVDGSEIHVYGSKADFLTEVMEK